MIEKSGDWLMLASVPVQGVHDGALGCTEELITLYPTEDLLIRIVGDGSGWMDGDVGARDIQLYLL